MKKPCANCIKLKKRLQDAEEREKLLTDGLDRLFREDSKCALCSKHLAKHRRDVNRIRIALERFRRSGGRWWSDKERARFDEVLAVLRETSVQYTEKEVES